MKRLCYLLPLLVLLASMIPMSDVHAYEEGDVEVFYEYEPGVWVEIEQNEVLQVEDAITLKIVLVEGEAVDIWTVMDFQFSGVLELGEYASVGYGISGSGSSQYSGVIVSGMDSPDSFTQAGDPGGGDFYGQAGPANINIDSSQYITWEITDDGGLPSTIIYYLSNRETPDNGDIGGPIAFTWGVTGFDPDCDDTYQIQESIIGSQEIDATDEDGETAEVETGNLYRLEVWGGPWDDGADPDRYDTAISWDGLEWIPLTELFLDAECYDVGDDPGTGTVFILAMSDDFYIRVNDEAAAFANNDGSMIYSLALALDLEDVTCSDQFEWAGEGDPDASYTVPADLSLGIEIKNLEIGEWYVYITRDGPWLNNGSTERYDMAVKDTTGSWEPIADYEMVECVEDADDYQYTRYFFQAWDESLWTRVNDVDGNWANDDSMGVDIYGAEFDRFLDTCEGTYIIGDLVISKTFQGNQSGGVNVGTYDHYNNLPRGGGEGPVEILRYYVIDTLDGPWYDGGKKLYTTQMRKEADGDWYETIIHPEMDCVAETDLLGHVRGYFDMDKPYEWYIRANETTTWTDNSGSERYNLYEATNGQMVDPEDPAEEDTCDGYYTRGDQVGAITFQATNGAGVHVPGMTEYNTIYSIVTTGGAWNDGSDDLYDVDISDDGGATWYPLAEYPGMLCKQLEGTDYIEVFLQHVKGRRWKVRVSDTIFSDNSGSMGIIVYGSEADIDPWHTCSDDYDLVEVAVPSNIIDAWIASGRSVPYIGPSSAYIWAIEIYDGPWVDDTTDMYTAEIWDGEDWHNHNSYGICSEQYGANNEYFRTYFIPTSSNYKLRADDQDDDFFNNSGSFRYKLFRAYAVDPDDPIDPDDPGLPNDWDLSCYTVCTRPSVVVGVDVFPYNFIIPAINGYFDFIGDLAGYLGLEFSVNIPESFRVADPDLAAWLEFGRCSFTKWLSWCPEHTAAIKSIPLLIMNRPPFNVYNDIVYLFDDISLNIKSYDWYPESSPPSIFRYVTGGGESDPAMEIDLIPDLSNSPWNGGSIEYGGDPYEIGGGESAYGFDCSPDMKEAAISYFEIEDDSLFIKGYCFVSRMPFILRSYWLYLQITVDLAFIAFGLKWFFVRLQELQF